MPACLQSQLLCLWNFYQNKKKQTEWRSTAQAKQKVGGGMQRRWLCLWSVGCWLDSQRDFTAALLLVADHGGGSSTILTHHYYLSISFAYIIC
jgi:hypothetical protein